MNGMQEHKWLCGMITQKSIRANFMIMVNITHFNAIIYNSLSFPSFKLTYCCGPYQQISTGVGYLKVTISQELWPTFITYQKAWEKMRASIWKTGEENGSCFQTNGKLLQSFTQLKLKEMQLLFLEPCMKSTLVETISLCSTKTNMVWPFQFLVFPLLMSKIILGPCQLFLFCNETPYVL